MSEKPTNARTVSTDALETLGKIHWREEKRDAVHLAVEPVTAGEELSPGAPIRVEKGVARRAYRREAMGIVDPFLEGNVQMGQRFWFVMMPRAVHSLRHVWTHPDFPDVADAPDAAPEAKAEAEAWLRAHAESCGLSYWRLMESAKNWLEYEDRLLGGDEVEYAQRVFDAETFWRHYETVTGTQVKDDQRHGFFSCSC